MINKYVYAQNGLTSWLRGLTLFPDFKATDAEPYQHPNHTFVWRNSVMAIPLRAPSAH